MKYALFFIAIFLIGIPAQAQGEDNGDSLLIHNLKQQLNGASGIGEVDLLNAIAFEYMWYGSDKTPAYNYALKAKEKAQSISYEKGIGYATLILAYQYVRSNKSVADSMFRVALKIGEKLNEARLIGWCYYQQWDLKKALTHFQKAGDLDGEAEVCTWLCEEYASRSATEGDFSYCQRAIELAATPKKTRLSYNRWIAGFAYTTMSGLYNYVGDYKSAFDMIEKAEKFASPRDLYWSYAVTYEQMGKNDSSLFYFEKALATGQQKWHVIRYVGYANQRVGNYKRAAQLLEDAANLFLTAEKDKKQPPFHWRGEIYSHLAEVYDSLGIQKNAIKNYKYALEHSRKVYQELQVRPMPGSRFYGYEGDRNNWMMKVSHDLSTVFSGLKRYDSSLFYLRRYMQMKDTIDSKKKTWQLNLQLSNYRKAMEDQKRTGQLLLLQKNNQLGQAKLKQETFLKNSLAAGLVLLSLVGLFIFRTVNLKRKNEKLRRVQLENELTVRELENKQRHSELQQKAVELEMQALRAQMNPHFIFNCLSSINRFVLKNETEAASDYLTRFSRLIRLVLINSEKQVISLEDEIEMLKLYLDMERLRFKAAFDYSITYSNSVDAGNILMPPLLFQPFCENAIWHGLMHKNEPGKLSIVIFMDGNTLHCTIVDNGIGRKKAAEINSPSNERGRSLGLKITSDRLALLNHHKGPRTSYEIEDLYDEIGMATGTKVTVKIYCKETLSSYAPSYK
jgi:tetratricopeptide (TPR) repeat protein